MKALRFFLGLFFGIVILSACQKSNEEVTPNEPITPDVPLASGQMRARIDGNVWTSQSASVEEVIRDKISINGQGNGNKIEILIGGLVKPGVFEDANYQVFGEHWFDESGSGLRTWGIINAKLNITKVDWIAKKMSGTFSFSGILPYAIDTIVVTDGEFKDIPINSARPPASMHMAALVNNVEWEGSGMYFLSSYMDYDLLGVDAFGQTISINDLGSLQLGTHTPPEAFFIIPVANGYQSWKTNAYPVVKITSYDNITRRVSGTFSFNANDVWQGGGTGSKLVEGTFTDIPVY